MDTRHAHDVHPYSTIELFLLNSTSTSNNLPRSMCLSSGSSEGSGSGSDEQGGGSDSDSEDINVDEQGRPAIGGSIDLSTRVFDGALPSGADPGPLIADCEAVFTARATGAGEGLSSGATFWVAANAKPKTALERLALQIFAHHAAGAEYDPSRSGAEWWTVVIDDTDDVGLHWDRDYDLQARHAATPQLPPPPPPPPPPPSPPRRAHTGRPGAAAAPAPRHRHLPRLPGGGGADAGAGAAVAAARDGDRPTAVRRASTDTSTTPPRHLHGRSRSPGPSPRRVSSGPHSAATWSLTASCCTAPFRTSPSRRRARARLAARASASPSWSTCGSTTRVAAEVEARPLTRP